MSLCTSRTGWANQTASSSYTSSSETLIQVCLHQTNILQVQVAFQSTAWATAHKPFSDYISKMYRLSGKPPVNSRSLVAAVQTVINKCHVSHE